MEAVKNLLETRSALEKAVAEFFDACTVLKTIALSPLVSFPNQIAFDNVVQSVLTSVDTVGLVESRMKESHTALNRLLNMSPSRVPINKLPPEILGRIFSFVAATSPCCLSGIDTLIELPLVCVKWNQVATSTRSLWTHIDISFGSFLPATILGRARRLLDRCRNLPVHIHFNGGYDEVKPADVPDIVATLQPHVGFLSSLYITSTWLRSLICGLLGLVSGPGAGSSLKRLSLDDIDSTDGRDGLRSLPVNMLPGLTQFELTGLEELACPSMGDTARVLSGCPALHTIRLSRLETPSDRSHDHITASLPSLRFLEITDVNPRSEALALLSKVLPGALELDVKLDADYTVERGGLAPPGQLFLARANVVSLSLNIYNNPAPGGNFESLFACVPRLRVLHLNGHRIHPEVARILGTKATNTSSLPLALLQSLCLGHCRVCPETADMLKQIIEVRGLCNLVFLACEYPPSFTPPKNHQQTQARGSRSTVHSSKYSMQMPESMKGWFSEQVRRVIVDLELPDAKVYHGVDPFVRGLLVTS
ncbi:hypothetical protein FRC12_018969 [Ceratobasidium sp. 428]|nr:hypothetical protein FRC12_018969 [Ceratobasidium sp. 428]